VSDFARLFLLLALAGGALAGLGGAAIWYLDEERRVRRALKRVLGGEPETVVIARGSGRGAGFSFASGLAAVAWESGTWCLIYRIDELNGAELIVDGSVVARAFRGEPRKALDHLVQGVSQITLRLVFDDPQHPDFELDLWRDDGQAKRTPAEAFQEANRWLARSEAILRRPPAPRAGQTPQAPVQPAAKPGPPPPVAAPPPPPPDEEISEQDEDDDDVF
jgi:hypothetical protein